MPWQVGLGLVLANQKLTTSISGQDTSMFLSLSFSLPSLLSKNKLKSFLKD